MISKRREEKKERRKKNSARITIMEGIGEINSWKVREWYYRGDVKRWEVMLLVESWWVLSNEDQDRSKRVKRGLRCRVDVSPFRRSPLYIFPSYTDCSHFPKFFFLLFLANCSNSKIISLFLLELTHMKLTRSMEGIFGNKGKVFFLTTKFLRGMEKDGRACVNGRFVSNDRWRAQIKVESSEREPSWKREPFPLPLCICTTYTRPSRPNISR